MKISIKIVTALCWMNTVLLFSQQNQFKKANTSYDDYAYSDAIIEYQKIIEKGDAPIEIYQKLGDCYFFNSELEDAAMWYLQMIEKKKELESNGDEVPEISIEHYFRTSQSLKFLKRYKEADSLMLKLTELSAQDSRARRLIDHPEYLEDIAIQSDRCTIQNLPINSAYVDFAPSIYKNKLVFASARGSAKINVKRNSWTQQPYLDLFSYTFKSFVGFRSPLKFSKELSSRLHESTSSFTKDGTTIYFTKNNLLKTKYGKDSTGVNRLKIYKATLNDNMKWSDIKELPFNNDQYSVAHPALSDDEKKLYFASDMPGGCGMSDIYVVDLYDDGTFGTPQNMGSDINTEGRDTFPFMSSEGVLYFASDGHLGLGGLDIFATNLINDDKNIYNIGAPINSSADDMTFIIDEDTKKGYFASNRSGGRGNDDIYSFIETTPLVTSCIGDIKIMVIDEKTTDVLENAVVEIRDEEGEIIFSGKTNEKGAFGKEIDCANSVYEIIIKKESYRSVNKKIEVTREQSEPSEIFKLTKDVPQKGIDLAKILDLKSIYFDSNKALILGETAKELDKVLAYMKEYPSIKIEIGSHTDSRGSDTYNLKLSERRATSTANYIISKGIDPSRVKSRGYGETVLVNRCSDGVQCSKEAHGKNRRSEFIVIEN